MNWTTIYITGNPDFKEEVAKKLENSDLKYMPGNIGAIEGSDDLYWLDATTALREFKEAIGGKLIWKHRLRFFPSLESFLEFKEGRTNVTKLSPEDLALIDEMRSHAA